MKKPPALPSCFLKSRDDLFRLLFVFFALICTKLIYGQTSPANAYLVVENLDRFPSDSDFVAARIQTPWGRTGVKNTNQDTVHIRLYNKGIGPLVISELVLSNDVNWKITRLNGAPYNARTALPLNINSTSSIDLSVAFVAIDSTARVRLLQTNLTINSNDDKTPTKTLHLHGLWQRRGEGSNEPRAQEVLNAFGFTTKTGFTATDPDQGANNKPKGDEVLASYFVRADSTLPVTIRQMAAYHGCCEVQSETLRWYQKGDTTKLISVVTHRAEDAQRLLPRKISDGSFSEGIFTPATPFGFKVGNDDWSDTLLNPKRVIGIRIWKAIGGQGQITPNSYILSNDYLGTEATNSDYNDNMYYVTNIRPEAGPASTSFLASFPSAIECGEQTLQSTANFKLTLKNLGQVYSGGLSDPDINISSVAVVGENASEFTASMPAQSILHSGETTTLNIDFLPQSEGLKTADLLLFYNNAVSPLRVPLYGIAKATGINVMVPYRLKSGASNDVTINRKKWFADAAYSFDGAVSYNNAQLKEIGATDDDSLYLQQRSSAPNANAFRYELPLENGDYWLRLYFAEIFWKAPGDGLLGGSGSRVINVGIGNELKLINLDVAGEVGAASALVKDIPVTVQDGKLIVNFSATSDRPSLSALEVYQFKAGTVTSVGEPPANSETPKLYPNPSRQQFTVAFPPSFRGNVILQLVDGSGKVYELGKTFLPLNGGKLPVDLSRFGLGSGIYFLRISTAVGKHSILKVLHL